MNLLENVSLLDKNWFRTGGKARYFVQPTCLDDVQESLKFAKSNRIGVTILGLGANVLISDSGINNLVINLKIDSVECIKENDTHAFIRVGSGLSMHRLIEWCLENQLVGLEEFSVIPASLGGAAYNNLHFMSLSLSDFVVGGEIIYKESGEVEEVDKEFFGFGYDKSCLHKNNCILLNVTLCVKKAGFDGVKRACERRAEITKKRIERYPVARTCGCFFKNLQEHEVNIRVNGKPAIWAAYYFDRLGYKGKLRVGDAMVSEKHANMIVNCGAAKSQDIVDLACAMQKGVQSEFGIIPQPECCLLGFDEYPLLKVGG